MNVENQVFFKNIQKTISENIDSSEKNILVAVAWITDVYILNKLLIAQKRGVDISIVFYSDNINNKDLFKELHENGAIIRYTNKLMHNKFCVIDEKVVINGSYNWTNNASNNHENIQITRNVKNIINEYISEFEIIMEKATSIDNYFKTVEDKFSEYLKEYTDPITFPVFIKINFNKFIISTYELRTLKNDFSYVFIKNQADYNYFLEYLFNNKIRNINYKNKKFELLFFKNVYETKVNNTFENFKYRYIVFDDENESELFDKKSFLKLTDFTYGLVKRKAISEVYNDLILYKNKLPKNINTIEDLKIFVKSFQTKLDYKTNNDISEELILYKIYYNLPISFNKYEEPNYSNENNESFTFSYLETDEFIGEKTNNDFFKINKQGEIISYLGNHYSYKFFLSDYNRNIYGKNIFSQNQDYVIYYDEFKYKKTNGDETKRFLYGLLDFNGNVILPALFDYIISEKPDRITFEILPIFYTKSTDLFYYYLTTTEEKFILRNHKERILRFEYSISNKKLNQLNIKKNELDYYLTDSNCIYANFYKTVIFITQIKDEIDQIKNYLVHNNLLNIESSELKMTINKKLFEIRNNKKNSQNCYVATMLYTDINHPKVEFLRQFRNEKLSKNILGKKFIKEYYNYSPKVVSYLSNKKAINFFLRSILDIIIKILKMIYYK